MRPPGGKPLLLLHGFPDFWYGWRRQIPFLIRRDTGLSSPISGGCNFSDKPLEIKDYHPDLLVQDVVGLLDLLAVKKSILLDIARAG